MHVAQGLVYGDLTFFFCRSQSKSASDEKQEPKRRTSKHPERPTTGTGKRSGSLASHYIDIEDDLEACFEQDGGDARVLPSPSSDKEECHTSRQLSKLQLPPVPAAVAQFVPSEAAAVPSLKRTQLMPFQLKGEQAVDKAQLAIASQAGKGRKSPVSPDTADTPATEPQTSEVQTDKAIVNYDKAAQGDAKQPAGGTTSATGLIAAFRPVDQLPASSAAAPSPASTAESNASDRQAAGDVQGFDLRSYLDALLQRAEVLRLELPAHRPEDACEKESAGTSVCLSTFALLLQC